MLFLLIVLPFFISCTKDSEDTESNVEFERNKRKWENLEITDYSIQEIYSCFCGGLIEWEIIVENGIKTP